MAATIRKKSVNEMSVDPLMTNERLDRTSPELWPESLPGMAEFSSLDVASPGFSYSGTPQKWAADFDKEDLEMLQEFGSLTTAQLMEKVKGLQALAFQLGSEEAKEMTRGKLLNILQRTSKK